jgi:hypothetical protein
MPSDLNGNGTGRVVLYDGGNGTQNDAPVSITVFFPSLSSGIRAVSVWVRALDDDCTLNFGNFDRYVIVRERNEVIEMPNPMQLQQQGAYDGTAGEAMIDGVPVL